MSDETCAACKFFVVKNKDSKEFRTCHRFPPQVTEVYNGVPWSDWPLVKVDDWCGEFKAKVISGGQHLT